MSERPVTTFALWAGIGSQSDWGDLLVSLCDETEPDSDAGRRYQAILDEIHKTDHALMFRLEREVAELRADAVRHSVMMGYALCATWPATMSDLDGWVQRALDYIDQHAALDESEGES